MTVMPCVKRACFEWRTMYFCLAGSPSRSFRNASSLAASFRGNANGMAHYLPPFLPIGRFSVMCSITDLSSCGSPCCTTSPVITDTVSSVAGVVRQLVALVADGQAEHGGQADDGQTRSARR